MLEVDPALIAQARRFVNGANVHYVGTWIFCYEMSLPNTPRRDRYEALLRDFVTMKALLKASSRLVEMQGNVLDAVSTRMDEMYRSV